MLPFQYRINALTSIRFRNVSTVNREFFMEIEPLNNLQSSEADNQQSPPKLKEQRTSSLRENNKSPEKSASFKTRCTPLCLNPNFELDEQEQVFIKRFEAFSSFDVLLKLRALNDPSFKVDFHVNFCTLELIARDMSQVRDYDFELVVFKFENLFFTTKALFHKLQETNLINLNVQDIRAPYYKKKENPQQIYSLYLNRFRHMDS